MQELLKSAFIFRVNTTVRTHCIHLSFAACIGHFFGHHQEDFAVTYMEKHTKVEATPSQSIQQNTQVLTIVPYKGIKKYMQ